MYNIDVIITQISKYLYSTAVNCSTRQMHKLSIEEIIVYITDIIRRQLLFICPPNILCSMNNSDWICEKVPFPHILHVSKQNDVTLDSLH